MSIMQEKNAMLFFYIKLYNSFYQQAETSLLSPALR